MVFFTISGKPINFGQIYSPRETLINLGMKIVSTLPIKSATCPWNIFTGRHASSTHRETPLSNISLVVGEDIMVLKPNLCKNVFHMGK